MPTDRELVADKIGHRVDWSSFQSYFNLSPQNPSLSKFCQRWLIRELCLFGSVLRPDFNAQSDIDVLVQFFPEADWSLLDWVRMEQELSQLWGRPVDIITYDSVCHSENWLRRTEILDTAQVFYAV